MSDIFHRLCIYRSNGIGPAKYAEIMKNHRGSAEDAADSLNLSDDFIDGVKREMDLLDKIGGFYISDLDDDFPQNLRHAHGTTPILSAIGNRKTLAKRAFSAVGTRHATNAGMSLMRVITKRIAENDCAVVSGMAIGTDTAAHEGALAVDGDSNTIAVLAGGVDYVWPLENQKLYDEIIRRGCVVSEIPVGQQPTQRHFARRDKILAALGEKLILGESNEGSGSLITAGFAKEFGRRIYAIPSHPSDPRSYGPNRLIRENIATLCMGPDDFFTKLELSACVVNTKMADFRAKTGIESQILDLLGTVPVNESDIAVGLGKNVSVIKRELVVMEVRGLVDKVDGGFVRKG
ncbi:MAG: DNA-protecting protein DprA [Alphaproteobacteria bacterium]|nr:DNA-protecting protein DprA [Alphaproteobacteria bacterium]